MKIIYVHNMVNFDWEPVMINAEQIRAARALLDWSTADLAKQTDMTVNGINKIERGHVQAQRNTIDALQKVFENAGVEFLEFDGVRRRPEGIDILNGQEGLAHFFDRVYDHLKARGGLICVSGVDEAQFAKHHGTEHAVMHIKRMGELAATRSDFQLQVLLREGDTNFMASTYCQYRWQPQDTFVPTPFYVFGENLALITFQADPSPKIMIIRSAIFADAYQKQFTSAWQSAKTPLIEKSSK